MDTVTKERDGKVVARTSDMKVRQADGKVVTVKCVARRTKRADDRMQRKLRQQKESNSKTTPTAPVKARPASGNSD